MSENLYLTLEESFPEDLNGMSDSELQVLDNQVQRQLDREVAVDGQPNSETEFRHYVMDDEFTDRKER